MTTVDLEPYRVAITEEICSVCVDRLPGGDCGRSAQEPCALVTHLEFLVDSVLSTGNRETIEEYIPTLRERLCANCQQHEDGTCPLRTLVHCAIDSYILRIVELIEEVAERQGDVK